MPPAVGGSYTLTWDPSQLSLWIDDQLTTAVTPSTTFSSLTQTPVYVAPSSASGGSAVTSLAGALQIQLNWMSADQAKTKPGADGTNATKISIFGAHDVPAYGQYKYTIRGAVPNPKSVTWSAQGGTVKDTGSNWAHILWDTTTDGAHPSAGWIGTPSLKIDGSTVTGGDINVVQVVVSAPTDPTPAEMHKYDPQLKNFVPGAPADDKTETQGGVKLKHIVSGNPGLFWAAHVTLNGPKGGKGVGQMNVGFIQNLTSVQYQGTYDDNHTLHSTVQDKVPLLDCGPFGAPWYDDFQSALLQNESPDAQGAYAHDIWSSDTPNGGPPVTERQGEIETPRDNLLKSMVLIDTFELDICVQTSDSENDANEVYTRRATVNWTFNGNGTIGAKPNYLWTKANQADAGTVKPASDSWSPVTDGSVPQKTSGNTANDERSNAKWVT